MNKAKDMIYRQAAIDEIQKERHEAWEDLKDDPEYRNGYDNGLAESMRILIDDLPSAQPESVIPHRNYKYLSDYWCKCGWHLGKMGDVNYCPNCGKRVQWDG